MIDENARQDCDERAAEEAKKRESELNVCAVRARARSPQSNRIWISDPKLMY